MRLLTPISVATLCLAPAVCLAQAQTGDPALKIPPIKISVNLETQPVQITVWGTVSPAPPGDFAVALTVDLGDFQDHLTPVLAAELNRSDHCGDRLTVERAAIATSLPAGVLTANVNFERYGCVKAFGKQIAKRLVGGHGLIEVNLTPSVEENDIAIAAEVRKVDADGSLGDVLRSGSLGDSLREMIAASLESAIQKSADLKSALPAKLQSAITLQTVQFADGGAGRLWLTIGGQVQLTAEQLRGIAKELAH